MKKHDYKPTISKGEKIADKVLASLVEKLKQGANPWRKPWNVYGEPTGNAHFFAVNLFTNQPYSGINADTLNPGYYAGFSQIANHGGKVNKGAKSKPVVWFGHIEKDLSEKEQQEALEEFHNYAEACKTGRGKYGDYMSFSPDMGRTVYAIYEIDGNYKVTKLITVLKGEYVFSIEDTTGLDKYIKFAYDKTEKEEVKKTGSGERWISAYCEKGQLSGLFYDGGASSYYMPGDDTIHLSERKNYITNAEFYSTAFHEMTHSTGAAKRLNRYGITSGQSHFGNDVYAKEELIAEMGAAMAMGYLGIECEGTKDNSAAYLASWLNQNIGQKASETMLKRLMSASTFAKKAFAYIAKFYEEQKEEKKQEKNKTPEMPKLPAVIVSAPALTARAYKAEPSAEQFEQLKLFRAFPSGEGVGSQEKPAMSEFWMLVSGMAIKVSEGTGDNLTEEDQDNGYCDYIYYSVYRRENGTNYEERDDEGEEDDGGQVMLEEPYNTHTTKEIAVKVMDFIFQDAEEGEVEKLISNGDIEISAEAPTAHQKREEAESEARTILSTKTTSELMAAYAKTDYINEVMTRDEFIKTKKSFPEYASQIDEALASNEPFVKYNETFDDFDAMSESEARAYLIENLFEELADKIELSKNPKAKYVITMTNDLGCQIDSDIIEAESDIKALEVFKSEHSIIEYPGDTIKVERY